MRIPSQVGRAHATAPSGANVVDSYVVETAIEDQREGEVTYMWVLAQRRESGG